MCRECVPEISQNFFLHSLGCGGKISALLGPEVNHGKQSEKPGLDEVYLG